jgi:hypothetical protein
VNMKGLIILLLLIAPAHVLAQGSTNMSKWAGKYPDAKFFNQPSIRTPLRQILTKKDYASINDFNLMTPIERVGDYLVTNASVKYSDPLETLNLAFSLKDKAVYVVFWTGETHRKFSTKNNQFNLPDEVFRELGLKEE